VSGSLRLDTEKIDEVALAMLYFTMFDETYCTRAWKGMDWGILDRLHEKGWIDDPKSKAKSVIVTDEGKRLAAEFVRKHFALEE